MSYDRGEGKDTTWSVYEKLLLKEYYYQKQMEEVRRRRKLDWKRFRLAAKAHNKIWGDLPDDLLRLKKPILPNRWINYREGWCSEAWGFTNADLTLPAFQDFAKEIEKAAEYLRMAPHTHNAILVDDAKHLTLRWEEP